MGRIALIGLPGSGKSSVGRLLARRLNHLFVDLDELITEQSGQSIPTLFESLGEAGFREQEKMSLDLVTNWNDKPQIVVATGGGIVVTAACREQLRRNWVAIYLEVSIQTLLKRLASEREGRPLLRGEESLSEKLQRLMDQRSMLYASTAQFTVNADDRSPEQVVDLITERLPPQ